MKNYFKNMKTITKVDYATYLGVIAAFVIVTLLQSAGMLTRSMTGMLVPICCYICMAVSLNLTVGILGELSLGHAGFMSVGAFSGVIVSMSLQSSVPNELVRLVLALVVLLVMLINRTKVGMAMRAVAKDFETSQLMGIKINSVISATFVIGSALAAVGSMLYFTTYPAIVPTSGAMPGLKAFVAAVFGGIGSIPGAVIGAFLIGICENFVKILPFEGATTFVDAFTFALLIIVLVFKPTGLFGEKATDKV